MEMKDADQNHVHNIVSVELSLKAMRTGVVIMVIWRMAFATIPMGSIDRIVM